jgi:hypothetical protein
MNPPPRRRSRPLLEEIEARILYSADLAAAVDAVTPVVAVEQRSIASGGEFVEPHAAEQAAEHAAQTHELVFVDASVPDAQGLIADIASQQTAQRRIETVVIGQDADGIDVISRALAQRHDIEAVHVLGHGRDGEVQLGSARLDFDTLLDNATRIKRWGDALNANADLLLYGCDVAQSDSGRALVDALARLTGADVAASENATGSAQLGGDWTLEYNAGAVQAPVIVGAAEQGAWDGLLEELAPPPDVAAPPAAGASNAAANVKQAQLGAIPLSFEQNVGQSDAQVDFLARGSGYGIWLTGADAVLSVGQGDTPAVVSLQVVGKNAQLVAHGENPSSATTSYFVGSQDQWHAGVANFNAVRYDNVYDGIDLRYYGTQRQLEYDFIVKAGADANAIQLRFAGAQSQTIADNGDLTLSLDDAGNAVTFKAPVAYQDGVNGREAVASRYVLGADGTVSFELGAYDHSRALVIDPVLSHASYFGGSSVDNPNGVAVDAAGYIYMASYTSSNNLPAIGGVPGQHIGGQDASVVKFTPDLSALVYSVMIGGGATDQPNAIAVDASGNAYVIGHTGSLDFPTVNAAQSAKAGGSEDGYVFSLNATGTALNYSTYLGGTGSSDEGVAIAVDGAGSAYVAGSTNSSNFPLTSGVVDTTYIGGEAFVAKYDAAGAVVYATFLGGSGVDVANGIALDASGNVAVVGQTTSTNFQTTAGAYQSASGGGTDVFVVKLNSTATALLYSTYLGGSSTDSAFAVALDASGKIYVTGQTASSNFDVTTGAYQTAQVASTDAFMSIIDPGASGAASLKYSTYLAGSGDSEAGLGIAADSAGRAYVTGYTNSNGVLNGLDAFVLQIDPQGAGNADVLYSSFLGGQGQDRANAGVFSNGKFIIAGDTAGGVTTTAGAYDQSYNGGAKDSFVAIYTFESAPVVTLTAAPLAYNENDGQVAVDAAATLVDADSTLLTGASLQITGNYVGAEDTLGFDNANVWGITGTWNAATATLTLSGSSAVANYQAALRTVTYRNSSEQPTAGTRTVSVSATDGTQASTAVTRQITVASIDDPPVITAPGAQTTAEDTALVFSTANASRISLADIDAGSQPIQVTLNAANGQLTLAQTTGLIFVTGTGTGNTTMTFTGTVGNINLSLDGLRFDPAPDFSGAASLQIVTNDQGNSGTGGPLTATSSIPITVTAVNDAPINHLPGPQATAQNTTLLFSSVGGNAITVSDVDAAGAPLQIVLTTTNGTLTLGSVAGLIGFSGDGSGSVTLSGNVAALNAALDGLAYDPTTGYGGPATVQMATSDLGNTGSGGVATDTDSLAITVSGNTAPSVVTSAGAGAYTEQAPAAPIDPGLTVSDPDLQPLDHAVVRIAINYASGEDLLAFTDQLGITGAWDAASGTLTLSGAASTGAYQTALRSVTYQNNAENPSTAARTITFIANDGIADSPIATRQILLTAVNDPPSITVPAAQSAKEDTLLSFSAARGNQISIGDVDAGASSIQVSLSALNGTLTLAQTSGLTVVTGADGSAMMMLSGTLADLNAALNGIGFLPTANFSGGARIDISVDDGGSTGIGGAGIAAASVNIAVASINDAPAGTSRTIGIFEDTPYALSAADFGFTDAQDATPNLLASVRISTLPAAGSLKDDGIAVVAGRSVSIADINAGKLVFTPGSDGAGVGYAALTFQVRDDGGTAGGGVDLDPTPRTLTFNVTEVNDAPVGNEGNVTMVQNAVYTFARSDFVFNDPHDAPADALLAVRLTSIPAAGALSLAGAPTAAGQLVLASDIAAGRLKFTPAPNAFGAAYGTFSFQLQDDGGTANGGVDLEASAHTMTIDVTELNHAPQGTDATVNTLEDTPHVFALVDFGFSDPGNSVPNQMQAVKIATLSGAGSLTNNGVAVNAGDFISALDIAAGRLILTPAADANGAAYATLTFQVQDDGGTAGGGIDLDPSANTLTVSVTAVNDAPAGADATVSTLEDTPYTFAAGDFGFSDLHDTPANNLAAIKIATLPTVGALTLSGVPVVAGQTIALGSISAGALKFAPAADASGAGYASFTFRVQDDGGTGNGGAALDPTAHAMTLDVAAVNDSPLVAVNAGVLDFAGNTVAIGSSVLSVTDTDNSATQLVYTVDALPASGSLLLGGVPIALSDTFTQAQVSSGQLRYASAATGPVADGFVFSVADGAGGALGPVTFSIAVTMPPSPPIVPPMPVVAVPAAPFIAPSVPAIDAGAAAVPAVTPTISARSTGSSDAAEPAASASSHSPSAPSADGVVASASVSADASAPAQGPVRAVNPGAPAVGIARSAVPGNVAPRQDVQAVLVSQTAGEPASFGMSLNANGMDPQFGNAPQTLTLEAYQTTLRNDHWVTELNHMRDTVKGQIQTEQQVIASSVAITGGLSVGYLIWLLRGGLLLTSLLSSLPAWHVIDPMPVLARAGRRDDEDSEDDDSLESLFGKMKAKIGAATGRFEVKDPASHADANDEAAGAHTSGNPGWAT